MVISSICKILFKNTFAFLLSPVFLSLAPPLSLVLEFSWNHILFLSFELAPSFGGRLSSASFLRNGAWEIYFLWFYKSENVLSVHSHLNSNLAGCRILDWKLFSVILKALFDILLASIVSVKKFLYEVLSFFTFPLWKLL